MGEEVTRYSLDLRGPPCVPCDPLHPRPNPLHYTHTCWMAVCPPGGPNLSPFHLPHNLSPGCCDWPASGPCWHPSQPSAVCRRATATSATCPWPTSMSA